MEKFYVTTAIDYPSGKPHMGHCYEKICADTITRFQRLNNKKVFFQTGLDEHGIKIQRLAEKNNQQPQKYVDGMSKNFIDLCSKYNISYDNFIRTTNEEHKKIVQEILKKVHEKGDIYKGEYEGLYCVDCETYYQENELEHGNCPYHHKPCENIKEEVYFFKMSKYSKKVLEYLKKQNYIFPSSKTKLIINRMEEGVKDLCISRSNFTWGIQLPFDKKHISYVWFDALLNYYSGNKKFWPADVHIIGDDILWHHSVIWLSMLASAELEFPKKLLVHGFINAEDGTKMSKTLNNVIDPMEIAKNYPTDSIRYYLIREIPFGENGNFSEKKLTERHNNELANDLGNLLQRVIVLSKKQKEIEPQKIDQNLFDKLNIKQIEKEMENYELHNALSTIWKFINDCNKYINDNKPWEKEDPKPILYNLLEAVRIISILLEPFLPETSQKIQKQLNIKEDYNLKECKTKKLTYKPNDPEILFQKIEVKKMEKTNNYVKYEDFEKLDIRVHTIKEVKDHPNADKLYILELEPKRQIIAGIKEFYKKEELIGKQISVIVNLEPKTIKGVESQGMMLAAGNKKSCSFLTPEKEIDNNSKVM